MIAGDPSSPAASRGRLLRMTFDNLDMHVHAYQNEPMRTTVEIPNEQRARLLKLAAERGEKGFSRLIQQALDRYLDPDRERVVGEALAALGTLSERSAAAIEESVRRLRSRWR